MSDFIKREDAIMALRLEYPMMPFFKENRKEWAIKTEGYRKAEEVIMKLPSVDTPTTATGVIDAIREAEYRGCMKTVEERLKGEWTSVLAELHERFDALEKELRKASAEMSAIIRTNLDRPKGEWVWNENGMDWGIGCWCCSECGMRNPYIGSGDTALLSNPHNWAGSKYCPNCGADMRERKDFQVIVNGNCTKCGKPLSGNRIFICEECEEQSKESYNERLNRERSGNRSD